MQVPGPPIAEIEAKLLYWLTPESFKPLRLTGLTQKLRDRLLTLPVMMAVVLSLVYRRISGLSEVTRVLESEGLLWVEPFKVSKQALSKRLACLPTELFEQIFELVMIKIQSQADKLPIPIGWESVYQNFSALWIADGSTLDAFTDTNKFFITRMRKKTGQTVTATLSSGTFYKDEIIKMGKYRSNPCHHEVRLVSVLWGKTWYYYLTNVKDPQKLSAEQVCELYRRRWKVEEAFLLTKRLLGLSYLWVGGSNGVEIQIYATWIFYACLNDLCSSVAVELGQPKERISVEMVFRGLYHFSRSVLRGESIDVVTYLVNNHKMLGLIKQERKRHRENAAYYQEIWGSTA
jgi:hypothetical protein